MDFICWQNVSSAHAPYPGQKFTAATAQLAAQAFAAANGVASGLVVVVPLTAFEGFTIGGATPVSLPPYV